MPDGTPDVQTVLADDNFKSLPPLEKQKVLLKIDPNYAKLPPQEQAKALRAIQYGRDDTTPKEGFWGGAANEIEDQAKGAVKSIVPSRENAYGMTNPGGFLAPFEGALSTVQNWERRKQEGRSVPYRVATAATEMAGIPTGAQGEEQAADQGDVAGVAGHAAVPLAEVAAGEAAGKIARIPKVRELGDAIRHPVMTALGGPVAAGQEDIFRATSPGAGAKDFNLRDNVSVAKDDLTEIQRKTPINAKGGIIRPDLRLRQFATNVDSHLQDVWNEEVTPQIDRWSKAQVDMKPIKTAMRDTITQSDREMSPSGVKQVEKLIDRMPDNDTLSSLAERRKTFNAYLRKFEEGSASDRAAAAQTKPLVDAMKAADKGIATQMFGELKRRGEAGIDTVERRYAALSDLRDAARSQMNAAESFRMLDRIAAYIRPKSLLNIHERVSAKPTSGKLLQRGMERLDKGSGATKVRVVGGPHEPLPPPPNRMLPAVGETGRGMSDPTVGQRAPGGPSTKLPPRSAPESAPGTFAIERRPVIDRQAPGGPNTKIPARLGYEPHQPGPLSKIEGRKYRTPDVNVIKRGTATPEVRILSNQPASSLPQVHTWADMRGRLQSVLDDPMATQSDKVAARSHLKLLARTTRTGAAEPEIVPHLAELVRTGKLSHGEIARMSRTGVIGPGVAADVYRAARGKGLPPPPASSAP